MTTMQQARDAGKILVWQSDWDKLTRLAKAADRIENDPTDADWLEYYAALADAAGLIEQAD